VSADDIFLLPFRERDEHSGRCGLVWMIAPLTPNEGVQAKPGTSSAIGMKLVYIIEFSRAVPTHFTKHSRCLGSTHIKRFD
jgi:hypothetical protein